MSPGWNDMTRQLVRAGWPEWVTDDARLYLAHTEGGTSLRALARREGCHASTVLRKVRTFENRRDDPLIDEALDRIGRSMGVGASPDHLSTNGDRTDMTLQTRQQQAGKAVTDDRTVASEARRILRRLCETGAVLAVAPDLPKAVVLRGDVRMAVVDRGVAQAFALNDWIHVLRSGKATTYGITASGRAALKRFLSDDRNAGAERSDARFADQHRDWSDRQVPDEDGPRRVRYNLAESPMGVLARRRDKDGQPFLTQEMVAAGERLREDFELAQMGPRVAQNWDRFLTAGDRGGFTGEGGMAEGPRMAQDRVAAALRDLGPGLGDMVLRCCCFLEGLEMAERRMGWSARSGKIVLRIALIRLKRHYDGINGGRPPLIG